MPTQDFKGTVNTYTPNQIVGDGTAGRKLRKLFILIENGTNASTIKVSSASVWNGDTNAAEDNLGKSGDTGDFALSASGTYLTLQASGITGTLLAVLAITVEYNASATAATVYGVVDTGGIKLILYNAATGAALDLTVLVDTGIIQIGVLYLTDA